MLMAGISPDTASWATTTRDEDVSNPAMVPVSWNRRASSFSCGEHAVRDKRRRRRRRM
jgi:hypothetical protein